jgi:acetyltransferase-like isoleucine patch superfamily enzyme
MRTLLGWWRRLQLAVWVSRARTRMRWVGIRLEVEVGEGVVFVRNPFVLAGAEPPRAIGTLKIRLGSRVRFAPGVTIEAEPGTDSVLEIGDGTRIGASTHLHLGGGSIRIGASSEIRDRCVLRTSGGDVELGDRCFMSYGCVLDAGERIVIGERVSLGERVTLVDHDSDESEPVVVEADTVVFRDAAIAMGAHVGASSQVAAGALVRDEHPDGVLLAGVPAEVVKWLGGGE